MFLYPQEAAFLHGIGGAPSEAVDVQRVGVSPATGAGGFFRRFDFLQWGSAVAAFAAVRVCGHQLLVAYLVGLARNRVFEREAAEACEVAQDGFEATGRKSRLFTELRLTAG